MKDLEDNHTTNYQIECFFNKNGSTLKDVLEDLYLIHIRSKKNN